MPTVPVPQLRRLAQDLIAALGTDAVISVTTTRIRAAVALIGSIPDGEAPSAALQQQAGEATRQKGAETVPRPGASARHRDPSGRHRRPAR